MDLQLENSQLQRKLKTLISRAEENQKIQQRYQDYEQRLLSCTSLAEFLNELLLEAVDYFHLATVDLVIYDPDYSIRDLLTFLNIECYGDCLQLRHGPEYFSSLFGEEPKVILKALKGDALNDPLNVLIKDGVNINSVALLPLARQGELIASLHFASQSSTRFTRDKATDFLVHLSHIAAVCFENCVAREQLKRQGQIDPLTQVANRRSFDEDYARELARTERNKNSLACMFVDVDFFKKINDTWGHQAGDLCLKLVAAQIQLQLRTTDILARYGGEEFVVVLPDCESTEAGIIAERIREAVENLQVLRSELELQEGASSVASEADSAIELRVSVGLCAWRPPRERTHDLALLGQQLLASADEAMYACKRAGRNRVTAIEFQLDTATPSTSQ